MAQALCYTVHCPSTWSRQVRREGLRNLAEIPPIALLSRKVKAQGKGAEEISNQEHFVTLRAKLWCSVL